MPSRLPMTRAYPSPVRSLWRVESLRPLVAKTQSMTFWASWNCFAPLGFSQRSPLHIEGLLVLLQQSSALLARRETCKLPRFGHSPGERKAVKWGHPSTSVQASVACERRYCEHVFGLTPGAYPVRGRAHSPVPVIGFEAPPLHRLPLGSLKDCTGVVRVDLQGGGTNAPRSRQHRL